MKKKAEEESISYSGVSRHIETKVALLEASISHIDETLSRFEKRFDKIDGQFDKLEKEMKGDFRWTLTVIAALGAIMAHGFHWF